MGDEVVRTGSISCAGTRGLFIVARVPDNSTIAVVGLDHPSDFPSQVQLGLVMQCMLSMKSGAVTSDIANDVEPTQRLAWPTYLIK